MQHKPVLGQKYERWDILSNRPLSRSQDDTKLFSERGGGIHQPPELRNLTDIVGRNSDVWSLACLIIRLLTRAILGLKGLDMFDDARIAADPTEKDGFFYFKNTTGDFVLNGAVDMWLQSLVHPSQLLGGELFSRVSDMEQRQHLRALLGQISGILKKALAIEESNRCTARELHETLDASCRDIMHSLNNLRRAVIDQLPIIDSPLLVPVPSEQPPLSHQTGRPEKINVLIQSILCTDKISTTISRRQIVVVSRSARDTGPRLENGLLSLPHPLWRYTGKSTKIFLGASILWLPDLLIVYWGIVLRSESMLSAILRYGIFLHV